MSIPNQYGSGPTLASIFPPVNPDIKGGYYGGFNRGIELAPALTPSATGVANFFGPGGYKKGFESNYLTAVTDGEVNDFNVGHNNALELAAEWEWTENPESGHNKDLS